jgi:hypothetical protein
LLIVFICSCCCSKCHKLGGFSNRNLLFHSSGRWKSEIKVSADTMCLLMVFPLCVSSCKAIIPLDQGPP